MKKIFLLLFLFTVNKAIADCNAPNIDLELHKGKFLGFEIKQFYSSRNDENSKFYQMTQDEVEKILRKDKSYVETFAGTGWLEIRTEDTTKKFDELNLESSMYSKWIKNKLVQSEHDLETSASEFGKYLTISNIRGFDLNRDKVMDILIFGVNPGANTFLGVIGSIDGKWYKIIDPICG